VRLRVASYIIASALTAAGVYLGAAQWLAAAESAPLPPAFETVGRFLFQSFRLGGFYIPIYLLAAAVLLMLPELKRRLLFATTAAVIPVLTVSLILQLMGGKTGPAALAIADVFGLRMGAFLLLLLLAGELLALYLLTFEAPFEAKGGSRGSSEGESRSDSRNSGRLLIAPQPRPETADGPPEAAEPNSGTAETSAPEEEETWSYFERRSGSVNFPDMPELPELRSVGGGKRRKRRRNVEEEYADSGEPAYLLQQEEPEFEELKSPDSAEAGNGNGAESGGGSEDWLRDAPHTQAVQVRFSGGSEQSASGETAESGEGHGSDERSVQGTAEPAGGRSSSRSGGRGGNGAESGGGNNGGGEAKLPSIPSASLVQGRYEIPEEPLLHEYPDSRYWVIDEETQRSAEILKNTLEEFKISAEVTGIQKGPVITMFEILPAPGVKLSKIVNLADNIALRLAASRVRIVAPIPGKHAVGIEVPNKKRHLVSFKEMLQSEEFQEAEMEIPLILGKDITGQTQIVDLVQTPHLLIAGATGSGKSVCVNSIIGSLLYRQSPEEVRLILVDPKIVELKLYNDIPHLLTPVITEPKRAFQALQYCLYEMERRYSLLDALGVRDIKSYNRKIKARKLATQPLPYIVVVVDEFADLMATSGKELEATLARLAAMSRAVGIHLVLATQRPSIDVITGLIKANIPSRIAFMVASKFDSRIIIDSVGAEKLLGKGDMLFTSAWNPNPTRMQGAYLSEDEVERVAEYVKSLGEPDYIDEEIFFEDDEEQGELFNTAANDPLMDKAVGVVAEAGKASASYLQRRLKIGYNRAARLVEEMEERGIVGPQNGSKPREILHIPEEHRE
jgi:S-DNA-T family DNA segregation ATPase FtsK/SpoIIIE